MAAGAWFSGGPIAVRLVLEERWMANPIGSVLFQDRLPRPRLSLPPKWAGLGQQPSRTISILFACLAPRAVRRPLFLCRGAGSRSQAPLTAARQLFLCRNCHGHHYSTQRERVIATRAGRRARKLRRKLGRGKSTGSVQPRVQDPMAAPEDVRYDPGGDPACEAYSPKSSWCAPRRIASDRIGAHKQKSRS